MPESSKDSRDNIEAFGKHTEEAFDKAGDALDSLRGKQRSQADDRDDEDRGGGDVIVNVQR